MYIKQQDLFFPQVHPHTSEYLHTHYPTFLCLWKAQVSALHDFILSASPSHSTTSATPLFTFSGLRRGFLGFAKKVGSYVVIGGSCFWSRRGEFWDVPPPQEKSLSHSFIVDTHLASFFWV